MTPAEWQAPRCRTTIKKHICDSSVDGNEHAIRHVWPCPCQARLSSQTCPNQGAQTLMSLTWVTPTRQHVGLVSLQVMECSLAAQVKLQLQLFAFAWPPQHFQNHLARCRRCFSTKAGKEVMSGNVRSFASRSKRITYVKSVVGPHQNAKPCVAKHPDSPRKLIASFACLAWIMQQANPGHPWEFKSHVTGTLNMGWFFEAASLFHPQWTCQEFTKRQKATKR